MLTPWEKSYDQPRKADITLLAKVHLVKAMVFPVVVCECDSWTLKKPECWRIDPFELWCWTRVWLLRVLWATRGSNQSILKEINPECSLEGLMLKLKLQYFDHLMGKADSFEKTLMLEKIESERRRGWQRMRWLHGINDLMDLSLGKLRSWWCTGWPPMLQSMGSHQVVHDWATELNWCILLYKHLYSTFYSPSTILIALKLLAFFHLHDNRIYCSIGIFN